MRRWIAVALLSVALGSFALPLGADASPTVPKGWKVVTYQGVGIDVPKSWSVKASYIDCPPTRPTVFLGPPKAVASCPTPVYKIRAGEVILGDVLTTSTSRGHVDTLNGLTARIQTRTASTQVHSNAKGGPLTRTSIAVNLPSKDMSVYIADGDTTASPGGAPGRAKRIMETIHGVGGAGNAKGAPLTGTVTGTARPCIGPGTSADVAWTRRVHVDLLQGEKVVAMQTVVDSYSPNLATNGHFAIAVPEQMNGRFSFREPGGTYVVKTGQYESASVVITPGKTVQVTLFNPCF